MGFAICAGATTAAHVAILSLRLLVRCFTCLVCAVPQRHAGHNSCTDLSGIRNERVATEREREGEGEKSI
ncbi:hypothetical protein PspLS_04734 [Pyricularia sp. CBS 133598]|nr:hypothetical protein PspLS_04734 [Pyricularia sp. CBS 133598]